ncbi:MAG: aminoacyl-tRNA hydrolase [Proteobacteria bacterium]|nr:aminoacyl-tRNA hydrolase [Pseudomonadota bacterium]
MLQVTENIALSEDEIEEQFIRAPGPGGQNVNKVASAVQLRFNAAASPALSPAVLRRLARLAGRRMTSEGVIVLTASRFRSQDQNRKDARERLLALIREAATPPRPRRATRTPRASKRRRLESKRQRSGLKKLRGSVNRAEE